MATLTSFCSAKITCSALISDNMVIQRNTKVKFWGNGNAGDKITVFTEWNKSKTSSVCKKDGKWDVTVETSEAGGPYVVTISCGSDIITYRNVLLGEVWLCSGQSNMAMTMKGYPDQPIKGSIDFLLDAENEDIRLFTVKSNPSAEPLDNCSGSWHSANPNTVLNFSAVGYMFANQLQHYLKIPIGIICSAHGGTRIEAWMNQDASSQSPSNETNDSGNPFPPQNRAGYLFNGNINPLFNYVIKGVIWYQGESNVSNYIGYAQRMASMVKDWRRGFDLGDLPFYFAEIAPYENSYHVNGAFLREEQLKASKQIPRSGMVSTIDVGEETKVHPAEKQSIAKRLSYYALSEIYGYTDIACKTPTFKTMNVVNDSIICLTFDHADNGLSTFGKRVKCIDVAGSDKIFYPASLTIRDKKVWVSSLYIKNPVAVRYGFRSYPKTEGYLYNTEGLPVPSFRTDNW